MFDAQDGPGSPFGGWDDNNDGRGSDESYTSSLGATTLGHTRPEGTHRVFRPKGDMATMRDLVAENLALLLEAADGGLCLTDHHVRAEIRRMGVNPDTLVRLFRTVTLRLRPDLRTLAVSRLEISGGTTITTVEPSGRIVHSNVGGKVTMTVTPRHVSCCGGSAQRVRRRGKRAKRGK